ncbi:gliding motility-associated peptidyl-prolyl isomerase GldI [Flavobacterium azooxidireducens]|uniref:Peptidyl-prolyl cis-trans isomerase n=1 Tax=Flavobacterium azooxidireducens TaxID=1871076 RepID=A0ABY4KEZ4_9FLAO|nr:gliding motility-associated peptidyl-prolyl isomerase GldI [Flavobacterium azooxidireducens]UPQ79385.1 gliding motility-associated peptidyl-prolyl isomerase GldI [Flavobacterium azooxidireducens]
MKLKFFNILLFFGMLFAIGCQDPEARRPKQHSSGSFMKESVVRNKKLIASEEKLIDSIIKSNPNKEYLASQKGYWYTYEIKNEIDTLRPKRGDVAFFEYEINDLKGNVIYTALELRPQDYLVDKEEIMIGLRDGIKLMRKNEKVTFLFPSHIAYGYLGDKNRIGPNVPIMCTVTLTDFEKESDLKKIKKENNLNNQ